MRQMRAHGSQSPRSLARRASLRYLLHDGVADTGILPGLLVSPATPPTFGQLGPWPPRKRQGPAPEFRDVVTATVWDGTQLADAGAIVENLAASARFRLREAFGSQDSTFAAGLPLGPVILDHMACQ